MSRPMPTDALHRSARTTLLLVVGTATVSAVAAPAAVPKVQIVSVKAGGIPGNESSFGAAISANGQAVAFQSFANDLVADDFNDAADVFVFNRKTGETTCVSVGTDGNPAYGSSESPSVSTDGRFVVFYSDATNLVEGDVNGRGDIFVRDMKKGITTRVSVSTSGDAANADSAFASISANGRFVAFQSSASNLADDAGGSQTDIFVHDRTKGTTVSASRDAAGASANSYSFHPTISKDGRYVAFDSLATNLVANDTNDRPDVFVKDLKKGTTTRVSVDSAEGEANGDSALGRISSNGRVVAFYSEAADLVSGDTNGVRDIFVRDLKAGTTTRVSVGASGGEANGLSNEPALSADGKFVAFVSDAANLTAGDTNGMSDAFVHDLKSHTTTRVSVDAVGTAANGRSYAPSIADKGKFTAFHSGASNLAAGDVNDSVDVFVVRK